MDSKRSTARTANGRDLDTFERQHRPQPLSVPTPPPVVVTPCRICGQHVAYGDLINLRKGGQVHVACWQARQETRQAQRVVTAVTDTPMKAC